MSKTLKDKFKSLSSERRSKIEARADQLILEEMTLRDLRKTLNYTQVELGDLLDMNQESISRLERRSDLLLSTLNEYIASMGGKLILTAVFPNRPPINLIGFNNIR